MIRFLCGVGRTRACDAKRHVIIVAWKVIRSFCVEAIWRQKQKQLYCDRSSSNVVGSSRAKSALHLSKTLALLPITRCCRLRCCQRRGHSCLAQSRDRIDKGSFILTSSPIPSFFFFINPFSILIPIRSFSIYSKYGESYFQKR